MSLSVVKTHLSSLKPCQDDICTLMDIVTEVALDLAETGGSKEDAEKLEDLLLSCVKLEGEARCFAQAGEHIIAQARQQPPEAVRALEDELNSQFAELKAEFLRTDLQKHAKVVAFKESLRNAAKQSAQTETEELDDDIAVTQSQVNFTCPLTQLEMVNPVKNMKCNHHYEQEAVIDAIKRRKSQKKTFRCPIVGCGNMDVKESDLVLDAAMKRKIQNQRKQGGRS